MIIVLRIHTWWALGDQVGCGGPKSAKGKASTLIAMLLFELQPGIYCSASVDSPSLTLLLVEHQGWDLSTATLEKVPDAFGILGIFLAHCVEVSRPCSRLKKVLVASDSCAPSPLLSQPSPTSLFHLHCHSLA